jgi:LPXTG-motif cell wall-anchored protein
MADEFNDLNENGEQVPPPPTTTSNKAFITAVEVLGGIFLLVLLIMALYVALILPRTRADREKQIANINSANTATAAVLTKVAISVKATQNAPTLTPTSVPATATSVPTAKLSATNVVAQATATNTPQVMPADTRTATVAALLTQAAQAKLKTTYLPTSTALPKTGIMEDVGIPGLVGVTILLLVVIFFVRRMRASSAS